MNKATLFAVTTLAATGCRGDPGTADYSTHDGVRGTCRPGEPVVPPDPFEPGDVRADLGIFYEGQASEVFPLTDGRNYFVFEESFNQESTDQRIEGCRAEAFILTGAPFWGSGIVYAAAEGANPEDFSAYDTMRVSLLSQDPSFEAFEIAVQTDDDEFRVDPRDYGYVNDGEWHNLEVPLSDFTEDFTTIRAPFILTAPGGESGDMLLVDNLYYEVANPE